MSSKLKDAQESKTFSFDSLEDVHENIQEESSDPTMTAVEAQETATVDAVKDAQGNKDSAGTVFDATLHAVNADGEPSVTPLGKFRKRRGTSKVSSTNKAVLEQQATAEQKLAARAAGQLAADMMIGGCVTMLGSEWVPIGEAGTQEPVKFDEHSNLRRAFGDYFEAKGIHDFPPGIALSIAMTSYIMPRVVGGKETRTRLAKAKIWIGEKMDNWKNRKRKNASQSDTGNDGKRKDDTSKETMSNEQPEATRHART